MVTKKYTKEDIEALKNDPLFKMLIKLLNIPEDSWNNMTVIKKDSSEDKPKEDTVVAKPIVKSTPSFIMNEDQLQEFVSKYTKLETMIRKLNYIYGIKFEAGNVESSIYTLYNQIIWDLIGIIFGIDNREQIANFCFGNSNLDTVHDLYEELV